MRDKSHDEIMVNRYRERPIEAAAMFHAGLFDGGQLGKLRIYFVMSGEHLSGAEWV